MNNYRRPENDRVPLLPTTPSQTGTPKYHYERRHDKYHDDPNDYRRRVPLPSPGNEEFAKYHDTP